MLIPFAAAALVAGMTGSWSPCGFSMIDTLAASGYAERRRTTLAACATFLPGALLGGVVTFGGLAYLGSLVHGGAWSALALGVVALAALLEAGNARVRPQVHRQVPESWRRVAPLPVASFGYGVLLGLGWTTYVLTLAVWALFALAFALGDPVLGVAAGVAFGLGRALPIVGLAPALERPLGMRVADAMAERPGLLRGMRLVDALALVGVGLALAPATALAATPQQVARPALDPTSAGADLAWESNGAGVLRRAGRDTALPGRAPALGGDNLAYRDEDRVTVADRASLAPEEVLELPGADKLAVSARWLAWREVTDAGDRVYALPLPVGGATPRLIASTSAPAQIGRPSLSGDRLAYHVASPARSFIRVVNLASRARRVAARGGSGQVLNPAIGPRSLLYTRVTRCGQSLRLRPTGRRERVLARTGPVAERDPGHTDGRTTQGREPGMCFPNRRTGTTYWTSALTSRSAYLTTIRGGVPRIVRLAR